MTPNVLSIAGSDPSGGAGIQADLKTFVANRVHGMAVPVALTAQNTRGVTATHIPPADFVSAQMEALWADIAIDAVKVGMLGTGEVARAVADGLARLNKAPVVLDPVLLSSSGTALLDDEGMTVMVERLVPLATVITPNWPEAARLLGRPVTENTCEDAVRALFDLGPGAVLLSGGHGQGDTVLDLFYDGHDMARFEAPRIETQNTHGTGCALSSALAAHLACGDSPVLAAEKAIAFVRLALGGADDLSVGKGVGPINHLRALWKI